MIIPACSGSSPPLCRLPTGRRRCRPSRSRRELPAPPLRPFMDREEAADAVPGAVRIIEPRFPQRPTGEAVELTSARALGEDGGGNRDMALEHAGEAVAHLVGRLADRHGAGDVGGAVDILAARIDQVERSGLELAVGLLARLVMDDGAVGTGARDAVEAEVAKLGVLAAQRLEVVGRLELVDVAPGRLL